jgi:hypothetical protein
MHRDAPELPEILRTVREFIEEITGRLNGQDRYHAMCANYLLAVAERELAQGPAVDAAEQAAFAHLPGNKAALAAQIRSGEFDAQWDELFPLMLNHVINKVRISKPEHLHPMHRAD